MRKRTSIGSVRAMPHSAEPRMKSTSEIEVDALLSEHARQESGQRHDHDRGDDEAGGDPGDLLDGGAERAGEVRHGDVDDRRVDRAHQRAEGDRERDQPLVDRLARRRPLDGASVTAVVTAARSDELMIRPWRACTRLRRRRVGLRGDQIFMRLPVRVLRRDRLRPASRSPPLRRSRAIVSASSATFTFSAATPTRASAFCSVSIERRTCCSTSRSALRAPHAARRRSSQPWRARCWR